MCGTCKIVGEMFTEYMLHFSDMKKLAFSSNSACNIFGGINYFVKHTQPRA